MPVKQQKKAIFYRALPELAGIPAVIPPAGQDVPVYRDAPCSGPEVFPKAGYRVRDIRHKH